MLSPEPCDVMAFSGDESNERDPLPNALEFYDFIDWYAEQNATHKIMIAGNHSAYIYQNEKHARKEIENRGIIYLNKSQVEIDGIKFWGEPLTPTFGNWYFMVKRESSHKHFEKIPNDTDVLITHGPPRGVLDLTENRLGTLEMAGDTALGRIINDKRIPYVLFGHIHSNQRVDNYGILNRDGITYSNASCVRDGRMNILHHFGNTIIV